MRDLPQHSIPMLGGLWGANNYLNITRTLALRTELFNMIPDSRYGADQNILVDKVWPVARFFFDNIYFSYHTLLTEGTFPTSMTATDVYQKTGQGMEMFIPFQHRRLMDAGLEVDQEDYSCWR